MLGHVGVLVRPLVTIEIAVEGWKWWTVSEWIEMIWELLRLELIEGICGSSKNQPSESEDEVECIVDSLLLLHVDCTIDHRCRRCRRRRRR